jgi:PIN domain nuclease of toxin-antitoxin system
MKLLLDTHALIWFYENAPELSAQAKTAIEDPANESFASLTSFWEMSIKMGVGKLSISAPLEKFVEDVTNNGIQLLPVEMKHIIHYQTLPFHHRDPFDRMIVAQVLTEGMNIVSADKIFDEYLKSNSVHRVWL